MQRIDYNEQKHDKKTGQIRIPSDSPNNHIDELFSQVLMDMIQGSNINLKSSHPKITKPSKNSPFDAKIEGLQRLQKYMTQDKTFTKEIIKNKDKTDDLFISLKANLQSTQLYNILFQQAPQMVDKSQASAAANNDKVVDVILHANQVIFELLPEVVSIEDYEKQIADMIPIFIENLGSPKAIVRKSTHKCIGTYVKLTKKLEFVLMHIIKTGLENTNSRTRQHSMLVLPALLSLKPNTVERENPEMKELIQAVVKRIQSDPSEIVSKTGKKLLLELQKCYSTQFQQNQIDTLANFEARQICFAVLHSDDEKLKELLTKPTKVNHDDIQIGPAAGGMKEKQFVQQQVVTAPKPAPSQSNHGRITSQGPTQTSGVGGNPHALNKAGRDIMGSANAKKLEPPEAQKPIGSLPIDQLQPQVVSLQKPKHPKGENGKLYGFLSEDIVQNLDENQQWKERTAAIEYIDEQLNVMMGNSEKKKQFMPYMSQFLSVILVFIKDINFKICLTAINITRKLLSLDVNTFSLHKTQLTTSLIEKLSDSKVVIRQAVLRCCGFIIQNNHNGLMAIAYHSIGYLQHPNWHVREGILHLLADCIISQGNFDELNGPRQTIDPNHLALNTHFISEMCTLAKIESKSKIQQMVIDCLALILDISPNKQKTEHIMMRELGISDANTQQPETQIMNHVKLRQNRDYLPALQLDGTVEFKPAGVISDVLPNSPSKNAQMDLNSMTSGSQLDAGNHYLQMRIQQQRMQQSNGQRNPESASGTMLPVIPKEAHSMQNHQSPTPAKRVDVSPYAQMLEKNRQYSVTVNKDQSSKQSRLPEPQPFQTPSMQMGKQDNLANASQFTRGPAPQSMMKQKQTDNFDARKQQKDQTLNQLNNSINNQYQNTSPNEPRSHYAIQKSISINKNKQQSQRLNETAASAATLIDDGRSIQTTATHLSSQANNLQKKGNIILNNQVNKVAQRHKNGANQSGIGDSHFNVQSTQDASMKLGYTPDGQMNQPRNIYSNELRQRTLDGEILSQNSQIQQLGNSTKNDFISIQQSPRNINDQKQMTGQIGRATQGHINNEFQAQQRNMSQSSGAPGGFNIDKTQINKRLQLLKSTFKYKNTSEIDANEEIKTFDNSERIKYEVSNTKAESEQNIRNRNHRKFTKNSNNFMTPGNFVENDTSQIGNPQITHNSFGMSNISSKMNIKEPGNASAVNFKRSVINGQGGPIKATSAIRQKDNLNTIHFEDLRQQAQAESHKVSQLNVQKHQLSAPLNVKVSKLNVQTQQLSAPPLPRKPSTLVKKQSDNLIDSSPSDIKRVSSVHLQNSNFSRQKPEELGETPNTSYNAPEEPLVNPEQQLKVALDHLKGDDWQKIFEGLNIIKRMVLFHKDVIYANNCAKEIIKSVARHAESMRSQLAKNSSMTLQAIYSELNQKDLDGVCDIVITTLLKKAIDTNHFVSEQADKALAMVCHACNESKVFQCLQMIPNKGPLHKTKVAICYGNIIQKLGRRVTTFKESVSLVKAVVIMLSEASLEVRNAAKLAVLTIRNNLGSQKEFDGLMMRCGLTDRQLDQCKKVVELGDEQTTTTTKYGQSMRGSSLDSRGVDQRRKNLDGQTQSSFNMANSFVSPNSSAANGFTATGNSQAFKKRQASVSKPIDPRVYEEFRGIIDLCHLPDWQKRLKALGTLNEWIEQHSTLVKNNQQSKFIQLIDSYCKLIQDNNAKIQNQSLIGFKDFLCNDNLRILIDQNITMIIQALTHNLQSTSNTVKQQSEQLFSLLEEKSNNINQVVQPIVAQINLPNQRLKAYLIQRLIQLMDRLDNQIIDRHIKPLTKSTHKIQTEAHTNPKLREMLQYLDSSLQSR